MFIFQENGTTNSDLPYYYTDYNSAKEDVEHSLKIAKENGDREGERRACSQLGIIHANLGKFKEAIRYYQCELEIAKEIGDKKAEGRAYRNLGFGYQRRGDFKKAIELLERSLELVKEVGDTNEEGLTYSKLGHCYQFLGDISKAIRYHELYLNICKKLENRQGEGRAYGYLGSDYNMLGDLNNAVKHQQYALRIAIEVGDRSGEGAACANLGNAKLGLGLVKEAILCHQHHLKIAKELREKAGEGRANGNLGVCYFRLHETKTAIDHHELRLKIAKEVGDSDEEGAAYGCLGNAYSRLGYLKKAVDFYERKLKIAQEGGNRTKEGDAYASLGTAYHGLRDFEKAIQCYESSLKIAKEVRDRVGEGASCANIGSAYLRIGDYEKAKEHYELHLKISQEVGDRAREGAAYHNLGNCYIRQEDFKRACEYYQLSLKIAEEVGDKDVEAKSSYSIGGWLEQFGLLQEARSLYQSSVEIMNDVRDRLEGNDEWKISQRDLNQVVYSSLWRVLLKQGKVGEALSAAEQGRAQSLRDLLEAKYGFVKPSRLSPKADESVRDALSYLPLNTVFIAVQGRKIFHWVIQKGDVVKLRKQEISDNSTVDAITFLQSSIAVARENIGVRVMVNCEDRSLDELTEGMQEQERTDETDSHSSGIESNALRTLYEVVIGPIADLVHGEELTIIPEGPLCLAPYAAFVDANSKYLAESFRIRVLPSISSLKLITDCSEAYHSNSGALLVGDPWVQEIGKKKKPRLQQLPCAKEEVEMIGKILGTAPLTGRQATKDEVLKRLSSVALVHIAAHGRIETGEIALTPNPTRASKLPKEDDYLLKMTDVMQIKLRARLVVLSCCHSGRGQIKAEGVVGIARAFIGAGARSVLVSLWAINDAATLEFMKTFYEHLLNGRSASQALSEAMKFMRESDEYNHVRFWAPFVLIGDDIRLEFGGSHG